MRKLVLKIAKIQCLLFASIGLLFGIYYSFGGLVVDLLVSTSCMANVQTPGLSIGTLMAFSSLIIMPLLAAFTGFILGIAEGVVIFLFIKNFPEHKISMYIKHLL